MYEREKMTPEQRDLIEEFGLLHEQMGGTRMTGRVSAWLLLCEPPEQSLTEIAEGLGVSKAAVSVAARMLVQVRFIERVGAPGERGDHYHILSADLASLLPLDHIRTLHDLIEHGLATVADREQTQSNYAIMHERLVFLAFIETELRELLARWEQRRAESAAPLATHHPDDDNTLRSGGDS